MQATITKTKKKKRSSKGDIIFHAALLVWPLLQFCVFYLGVNLNSFKLAFTDNGGAFVGFDNFEYIFTDLWPDVSKSLGISVISFVFNTAISLLLSVFFAYYIFKKFRGAKFFRFLLFLPSIASAMVMCLLFHQFFSSALPQIFEDWFGIFGVDPLGSNSDTAYWWVMGIVIVISLGTTTLIYSNRMGELSPELMEAAKIDGANSWQEFIHIVVPFTYPTICTFLVTGIATMFVNQYCLFNFYSGGLPASAQPGPMGFYIFNQIAGQVLNDVEFNNPAFNHMAALGLLLTIVVAPVTLLARWLLEKYGPKDY